MESRRRALLATLGSGADLAVRQVTQFGVGLVLARLVSPEEFGTIALLAVFVLVGGVVADAGITMAVLQARTLTNTELSTAYWSSVGLGALVTGITALLAAPLASAFGRPELANLAAILSLAVVLGAVGLVPAAMLVKRLAFGRLVLIGALTVVGTGAASITLAATGHGLWALTAQFVGYPALSSVLLLLLGQYHPRAHWDRDTAMRLLRAGRWVVAANLVESLFVRLQTVAIGSVFGTAALGRYQRADSTQQAAADATSSVIGRVALPLFAESADRPDLLREGLKTGIRSTAVVNAPLLALLAALSTQALVTVFGPQWEAAGPILTVLCLAGLLSPMHVLATSVLYSMGENRVVFHLSLASKGLGALALAAGTFIGFAGVAWAQAALSVITLLLNGRAVYRAIGLGIVGQLRETASPILLASLVGAAVAILSHLWTAVPLVQIVVLGGGGAATYVGAAFALRLRALHDLLPLVRRSGQVVGKGSLKATPP